jgi:stage V sporulation protein G
MAKAADALELTVQRLIKFDGEGSLRAFCDLQVGDHFMIKGLRVVNGRKGMFVSMPRQQGKDTKWYDMVETMSPEVKQEVDRLVLAAYENA